jgi:hypothetical protein
MEGRPEHVRKAQVTGDAEALSHMGARGGINAGLLKADRRQQQEKDLQAHLAQQEQLYHISDEGDILPPDPEIEGTFKH